MYDLSIDLMLCVVSRSIPDQSLDAIFVDGCHLYDCVVSDLEIWLPKVRPGGLVSGHDFSPQWPGCGVLRE